jgi:hypothetical protein
MEVFCCKKIKDAIEIYKAIDIEEEVRGYFIEASEKGVSLALRFCPFCGSDLGKRLNEEYYDTLENEYGIEDPDFINFTNVPEEFKSDKWWRKRGL